MKPSLSSIRTNFIFLPLNFQTKKIIKLNWNFILKIKSQDLVPLHHNRLIRFEILPEEGYHRKNKQKKAWEKP